MKTKMWIQWGACTPLVAFFLLAPSLATAQEPAADNDTEAAADFLLVNPDDPNINVIGDVLIRTDKPQNANTDNGRYWIGVQSKNLEDVLRLHLKLDGGIIVGDVVPDSPADKAGIEKNDIMIEVGEGMKIKKITDLINAIQNSKGMEVHLKVLRAGEPKTIKVKPAKQSAGYAYQLTHPGDPTRLPLPPIGKEGHDRVYRFFGPGIVGPDVPKREFLKFLPKFPEDLHITINKEGDKPADITVKQGGKSWNVTEDLLSSLPEEVRPYVDRLLGRRSAMSFHFEAPRLDIRKIPSRDRLLNEVPAPVPLEPRASRRIPNFENRLQKQLEEMSKQLEALRKDFEEMRNRQEKTEA